MDATTSRTEYLLNVTTPSRLSQDDTDCVVCMRTMSTKGPNRAVFVHDRHILCAECLHRWTRASNQCPHCRQFLFYKPEPSDEKEDQSSQHQHLLRDDMFLRRLHGSVREMYMSAIAEQDVEGIDIISRDIVQRLRRRVALYLSGDLVMNARYQASPGFSSSLVRGNDEEEEGPLLPLHARNVIFALWQQWYFTISSGEHDIEVFEHPLSSALLFETFKALQQWDGDNKTPEMLCFTLSIRYRHFERWLCVSEELRGSWEAMKMWMLDTTARVFAGEAKDRSLPHWAECHTALFE